MRTQNHRPRAGRYSIALLRCLLILAVAVTITALVSASDPKWRHRSSKTGDILCIARDASILGAKHVVCGWLAHNKEFTRAHAEHAIVDFNHIGKALRQHGLAFCYHLYGYEFQTTPEGTLFGLMAAV